MHLLKELFLQLYEAGLPLLLQLIAAVLGLLLIRATTYAKDRWGLEIEARHREALHSALMSGITAALARGLKGQAAIDAAVIYADASVPDALSFLTPSSDVLFALAEAKLRDATGPALQLSTVIGSGGALHGGGGGAAVYGGGGAGRGPGNEPDGGD